MSLSVSNEGQRIIDLRAVSMEQALIDMGDTYMCSKRSQMISRNKRCFFGAITD